MLQLKRIVILAINLITEEVLTANSVVIISGLIATTNASVSNKTIRKYLLNGKTKIYLHWKFLNNFIYPNLSYIVKLLAAFQHI